MPEQLTSSAVRITVPMPPNIANGSHGHWRARNGGRKRYLKRLDELQGAGLIPAPPRRAFARASIASTMHLGGAMDDDNAMRRHKWVLDWLKTRGYVEDDKKRVLTWANFPEQIIKRGQDYRIELTLTPLPRAG